MPDDANILHEEIFGPVLPIRTWQTLDEAITWVNADEKPLALYVYSETNSMMETVLRRTSSGDAGINMCVVHFINHHLPFGGVNNSGMGKGHGYHGFKAFSHERSVIRNRFSIAPATHAPYDSRTMKLIKFTLKWLI